MVLKTDDHATLIDFATTVLNARINEIEAVIRIAKESGATPATAWTQIQEIMRRQ